MAAAAFLKAQAEDIGCVVRPRSAQRLSRGAMPLLTRHTLHCPRGRLQVELIEYAARKPLVLMTWAGRDVALPSVLLNSHTDVVPAEASFWRCVPARAGAVAAAASVRAALTGRGHSHVPFAAELDAAGRVFARGSQDMKCVGMQYLEAIRRLKAKARAAHDVIRALASADDARASAHRATRRCAPWRCRSCRTRRLAATTAWARS